MNILQYILNELTEKEISVYRKRKVEKLTLEEVGKTLGVTRERIRQIEAKVIDKIDRMGLEVEVNIVKKRSY